MLGIGQMVVQAVHHLLEALQFGAMTLDFLAQIRKPCLVLTQVQVNLHQCRIAAFDAFAHLLEVASQPLFIALSQALKGHPILSIEGAGEGQKCRLRGIFLGNYGVVWAYTAEHIQQAHVLVCG